MARYVTPLRYPGGKQKITPFIREVIQANGLDGGHYVEPYAGGAGVAVELLIEGAVGRIHLNDSCRKIYAIWWSILNQTEEFCRRIRNASLTVEEWHRQRAIVRSRKQERLLDLGFGAFYLNRVNRSGIISGGLIGGLQQTGPWKMDARFPRNELIRRVELIASKKDSITIKNHDAEVFISDYLPTLPKETLVYFDPPYYHKAKRLYLNIYEPDDHSRLAKLIQRSVKLPWLVSYDNAEEIQALYSKRRSFTYSLQYNAARCYEGAEFFAFSDKLTIPEFSELPFIADGLLTLSP
jgi:DNA adenine methylase